MLTYLKNLFRKKSGVLATATTPNVVARSTASDLSVPIQRVETASLQLLAIMAKFPDDLRQYVAKLPPPEAMVALPLPTILKFLPTGSVKMSFASVVRQAPPGTFTQMPTIEKRAVEVPLAEIFKRVSPAILKKRDDQRYTDLADDGFDIFGDDENPYALAPRVGESSPASRSAPPPMPSGISRPAPSGVIPPPSSVSPALRVVQMPEASMVPAPPPSAIEIPAPAPSSVVKPPPVPPAAAEPPAPAEPVVDDQPPLVMPLKDLIANWPEPIKSEAASLNGATVSLPSGALSAGLAKGKVSFQWGQIRAWLTPPAENPTEGSETTELPLPLRVVAPAFLKHSKKADQPKKKATIDDSIPPLFSGGREPAAAAPAPAPAVESLPAPVEMKVAEPAPVETPEVQPAPELKIAATAAPEVPEAPAPSEAVAAKTESAPAESDAPKKETKAARKAAKKAEEALATAAPAASEVSEPAPVAKPLPQSVGELFNEPGKAKWSPPDLIAAMLRTLPTVEGAIVALQEGLVVAHQLPEGFKDEVFAAFLPQMFARVNQYSGEMKLGVVHDIVLNADGRQCQLFRMGQVFFGVLAKPNENLPSHELRLCANALAE